MRWDPTQYARYSGERGRPFFELVARVGASAPRAVVDLGCGSGELTVALAERWPQAQIRGFDASAEMIARAPRETPVRFAVADAREFDATGTDVLISNAMLQWLPGHDELLRRWAARLNADGWLAFQVPANFDAPSHRLMRELAESPEWRARLHGVLRHSAVATPAAYLDLLAGEGLEVDAWQTEYQHVLRGEDSVLEWVRGTGLRPVLAALAGEEAQRFSAQYAAALREAYPQRPYGTVFGFARTFVVAHKVLPAR
ncbi:MAG TPA: trans-aconitate 2-methyltransferase [Solirubrobacteraceae bacterium]|nr:trans-aconitate 2-methyltransferase [Solirubrobacteraceae bacterium]